MATEKTGYWFPRRVLHTGHFPLWTWLFPPFWLILVPMYALWLVALVIWLVISIPVNLVRIATHRQAKPVPRYNTLTGKPLEPARYDVYTGELLAPRFDTQTGKRLR
jgi:hypothetical protein